MKKEPFNLSDLEGNQGWWEGHRKSQDTPDLLKAERQGMKASIQEATTLT